MPQHPVILLVEDKVEECHVIRAVLERYGYEILVAHEGVSALSLARKRPPDLVILDVQLPDMSGFDVQEALRRDPATASIRVLFATVRWKIADKARGFGHGADDFVTKPFAPEELVMRISAILRRPCPGPDQAPWLVLDPRERQVRVLGRPQPVSLSEQECRLLSYLMAHPYRPISGKTLMAQVLDGPLDRSQTTSLVRRLIWQLREKLEPDPKQQRFIRTQRRSGYMYCPRGGEPEIEET